MTLTCECGGDYFEWWHDGGREVAPLATKRWRSCCSCKERIAVGDDAKEFVRWRNPTNDVEWRIYGDTVPTASWWMCDRCAGLYESLDSLGFCELLGQNLVDACREYAQMQRDAGVFRGQMEVKK